MKYNILLVEEDIAMREKIKNLLLEHGYNVIPADSGITAINLVKKKLPDLVICELYLSDMDSYDLYSSLFMAIHNNNIPFIYFTTKLWIEPDKKITVLSIENSLFGRYLNTGLLECINQVLELQNNTENNRWSIPSAG